MTLAEKVCPVCQKTFMPTNGRQIYCAKCKPLLARFSGKRRTVEKARNLYLAEKEAEFKKAQAYFAPGCEGCKYWRAISVGGRACHYALDNEKRRPCKPGKDCTVRVEKKRGEIVRKPLTLV